MSRERVEVRPPPELQPGEGAGGLLLNGLPMLGSVGSILLVTTMSGGDRARGWLAGGMFLLATLGFIAVQVDRQRRQRRDRVTGSRDDYLAHLDDVRAQVRAAAAAQRAARTRRHPPPTALPALVAEGSRVWERGRGHPDHLQVRRGLGVEPLALDLPFPDGLTAARADPAAARAAHRLVAAHRRVPDVPVPLDLRAHDRIGVDERAVARALLCSAVAFHHPDHLRVAVLADEQSLAHWDWVKWLPHAHSRERRDAVGPARLVATSLTDLMPLLDGADAHPPTGGSAHLLLVLDGVDPPTTDLPGVTLVEVARRCAPDRTAYAAQVDAVHHPTGEPDRIDAATAEAVARRLAARAGPGAQGSARAEPTTPDLLGLTTTFDPARAWRPRPAEDLLRVPIGTDEQGAPVWLDLKESAQQGMGPHGLVIGATGSGKSELLRTLVLGLAATHGPEQLNLVLVDFKGGATFAPMAALPHVAAVITNLEHDLTLVDRMQDALAGEMVRRQEVLRAGGHASARDHERARTAGAALDPLPSLVIVVDEFSELLSAKPEFLELFVAIGRLGRSLGLHLLLASQRLDEGRLRGLESHLSYRIALRTFSAGESRSVIGVPDAHTLPAVPGAAILRPDPETLLRFAAGYVSGPALERAAPASGTCSTVVLPWTIAPVEGPVEGPVDPPPDRAPDEPLRTATRETLLDRGVEQMRGHGPRAHQVWLPPLEAADTLDTLMPDLAVDPALGLISRRWREAPGLLVPLGRVDRPRDQRRDPLVLDLDGAGGHVVVVGGPRSGKTTVLRTLVTSLALTHTPRELQVFVIDAAGGGLTQLAGLPQVAGVATRSEPDVARRVVAEVEGIVERREAWWRERGIDSIEAYRARRAAGHDDDGWGEVVLVVDGWATLRADADELETRLQHLAGRALAFGVHLVASAARWTDLRPALRDVFGSRLELRLGDPLDSEVDRSLAAGVPAGRPGRGLLSSGLHTLTALPRLDGDPDGATASEGLGDLVRQVRDAWPGPPGPRLRLLPERIDLDRVRDQARTDADHDDEDGLLLGVDEAALAPVRLDPSEPHLLVLGDGRSGKTALLRTLVHEVTQTRTPAEAQVVVVDYRRALLGEVPDAHLLHHLATAERAGPALAELADFLRRRLPGPDVTPTQLRQRSWWTGAEVWVVVDDHDLVATPQSSPLLALQPLLAQAGDVGLHLVVARRSGGIHRAFHEPVLQSLRDLAAPGVLLSGSPEEGPLVGGVRPTPGPPGRARLVTRERGARVMQVAWSEPVG